jgi:hypothetical protein
LEVLLICERLPNQAATVLDHIDAIKEHTQHRVLVISIRGDIPHDLDLDRFDAVIIHYSVVITNDQYLSPLARERLQNYGGLKVVFIQDEYRWINRTIDALVFMGVKLLFTCIPEDEVEKVYPVAKLPNLFKVTVLTGYVPPELLKLQSPAYDERPIDVGYRTRKLSAFYGQLAREKWLIADRFEADAAHYNLILDFSYREEDRIYGAAWVRFIQSCKAMLGAESGASVFDFSGELMSEVEEYEGAHPAASFEEIRDACFFGLDGLIRINQISPRCFEAAALRTLMVLYEGDYSGVLVPWKHYVPLKKDHSNMLQVVEVIRDKNRWQTITQAAYDDIAQNPRWGYPAFGAFVGKTLTESRSEPIFRPRRSYSDSEFEQLVTAYEKQKRWRKYLNKSYTTFAASVEHYSPKSLFSHLRIVVRKIKRRCNHIAAVVRLPRDLGCQTILATVCLIRSLVSESPAVGDLLEDLCQLQTLQDEYRRIQVAVGGKPLGILYLPDSGLLFVQSKKDHDTGIRVGYLALVELLESGTVRGLFVTLPGRGLGDEDARSSRLSLTHLLRFAHRHPVLGAQILFAQGAKPTWL